MLKLALDGRKCCKIILASFIALIMGGMLSAATPSTQLFQKDNQKLIVYSDVPGESPSKFYHIRVRSALTNNEWVDCFAHNTYNKAEELGGETIARTNGRFKGRAVQASVFNYVKFFTNWSHTYANIEVSPNSPVEVEISSKNGFKIRGKDFEKAAARPARGVLQLTVVRDGKVYFKIDHPSQIVIDINGQLDAFNKAIDDKSPNQGYVAHTVSLFANPIMDRPQLGAPGVVAVEPGTKPPLEPDSYTTLYFKPGVHVLGPNIRVYPGKNYYIPGDAIVFGTMNSNDIPAKYISDKQIRIYGTGTLSGARLSHPGWVAGAAEDDYKSICIRDHSDTVVEGICFEDPAHHTIKLVRSQADQQAARKADQKTDQKDLTTVRWIKIISWRANGDGVGSADLLEDSFIRTNDDNSYIKGDRRRCIFWQDRGAAVFHMAGIPNKPLVIEDCEVIYYRSRTTTGAGLFVQRGSGAKGVQQVNLLVRNFRVTDPRSNSLTFTLASGKTGSSYQGITFQNVVITHSVVGNQKQQIIGSKEAPWNGGITFENVTIAGKKLKSLADFKTNEYV